MEQQWKRKRTPSTASHPRMVLYSGGYNVFESEIPTYTLVLICRFRYLFWIAECFLMQLWAMKQTAIDRVVM